MPQHAARDMAASAVTNPVANPLHLSRPGSMLSQPSIGRSPDEVSQGLNAYLWL